MRCGTLVCFAAALVCAAPLFAGDNLPEFTFRAGSNEVMVSFVVKDARGQYVKGLGQKDVTVYEDGESQTLTSFFESRSGRTVEDLTTSQIPSSVYVLMDTSSCVYTDYAYTLDAVRGFIRDLPASTAVAVYSFSRNMHRVAPLSLDRLAQLSAVQMSPVGDDPAIYDSLLLTLRDAVQQPGRKSIIVFTNGPDHTSRISPTMSRAWLSPPALPSI